MAVESSTLPEELFEEILLRLPPDDPACLFRASLVCKAWGYAVSRPGFHRRLHELHQSPPVIGFLHDSDEERIPDFIPTTASSFSLAASDRRLSRALDYRHRRALFLSDSEGQDTQELLMWEPVTSAQQHIPMPVAYNDIYANVVHTTAAVFCGVDGCDHRDCLGGHFRVLFVLSVEDEDSDDDEDAMWACVFSSETGTWGELTSLHHRWHMCFTFFSSVLVEWSQLYFMADDGFILEYNLARHNLTVFNPPNYLWNYGDDRYNIMLAEDGGLGVNEVMGSHLRLWAREVSDSTNARWVLSRVIYMVNLLPIGALVDAETRVQVLGFAEGANVILVTTVARLFTIELQSERTRKVCDDHGFANLIPIVSFYTPVTRGEHKDRSSKPSEAAGPRGALGEEKIVDQARQFINSGSNVTKDEDFVNSFECVSHAITNRAPPYEEVASECTSMVYGHGCDLPYEAQELTGPWGDDVPKSA
ncbi:uncharacterized protein LOC119310513 [Triticum dicoccoides]|uniref:uncharacterized protein LOC119310513 n=1 Tax=Triticum dicoccoides TaxID=85692 RepID=UPI001891BA7C|nr:uncharacterized protein LOC119310513 [Triticum dicoccoides]